MDGEVLRGKEGATGMYLSVKWSVVVATRLNHWAFCVAEVCRGDGAGEELRRLAGRKFYGTANKVEQEVSVGAPRILRVLSLHHLLLKGLTYPSFGRKQGESH